eukprot:COSAG05_NODE_934_length_6536_cov_9.161100_6_plen_692_part_00
MLYLTCDVVACCGGGSGLSYTTFSYSQPKLNVTSLGPCDTLGLSVEVHNTGGRDGDEVVQLYSRQPEATVPVPNIRLVAFERVTIPAGTTAEVELTVAPDSHAAILDNGFADVYNGRDAVVVEKGRLELFVGGRQPPKASSIGDQGWISVQVSSTATVASCSMDSSTRLKHDDVGHSVATEQRSYTVTAERTNFAQPVIATHLHMPNSSTGSHTASSEFFFNFNPTSLQLPDGTLAIILRTVANQTNPATRENPDFLTLSRVRKMGDSEGRGAIVIDPVNESSIILCSTANSTLDDRGVQDPRVMRDPETGIYWLTASSIGSSYVGTVISSSVDGVTWKKVSRCDADHTHPFSTRIDPITNRSCNYGRAASILWRESGEHYMIWGAGTLNLARSINRSLIDWVTVEKAWLAGLPDRGAWVNPGGAPVKLADGNYLFLHVEAGMPKPPLKPVADPCPGVGPDDGGGHAWWGMGWAVLSGSDPSQILQRGSELLFPSTPWEKRTGEANKWEWRGCMIGDASGLMPLEHAADKDTFLLWYGGGDSLSGAAVVKVWSNEGKLKRRLKMNDTEDTLTRSRQSLHQESDLHPPLVNTDDADCAASDANLLHWRQLVCSSLVQANTSWCGTYVANGASADWPSQATYLVQVLRALVAPSTCLNTSLARGTVSWLDTDQTISASTTGNFFWTWLTFQVQ